jgi:anti-anti-sigma regulatory factor
MTYSISLPPRVDISSVSSLREEWLSGSASEHDVVIDGTAVEVFSAAAAQLILSFANMLKATGGTLKFFNISKSLQNDFITLGLSEFIEEFAHNG